MAAANSQNLPEIFVPEDAKWASRAAARGEIRRLARGLYTRNLDEPAEQLVRRRWYDVAALYFPGAVIVDRSAAVSGPAADGSLFLDIGERPVNPRPVALPGPTLRPRNGPGPVEGDGHFAGLRMSGLARTLLDNLRPSRARSGVARTLRREEIEDRLDRIARLRGDQALNELRDEARAIARALDAEAEFAELDRLIGALLGIRNAELRTAAARARRAGLGGRTALGCRLEVSGVQRGRQRRQMWAARIRPRVVVTERRFRPVDGVALAGASARPAILHCPLQPNAVPVWRHRQA